MRLTSLVAHLSLQEPYGHPEYNARVDDWYKYRKILESGRCFIEEYLVRFSDFESEIEYQNRLDMAYNPAFAKSLLLEIKNAIYQRMVDVRRQGGDSTYQACAVGQLSGVDNEGSSMKSFIGGPVLEELLGMGKVGIYVDKASLPQKRTKASKKQTDHPYMYVVQTEDIVSWAYSGDGQLKTLLLKTSEPVFHKDKPLVQKYEDVYYLYSLVENKVQVSKYEDQKLTKQLGENIVLDLPEIPFIILELPDSLLKEIADYQIALLNLVSSDLNYSLHSNFPFYTEQFDPRTELAGTIRSQSGNSELANTTSTPEVNLGSRHGRRYPTGNERPEFINPSPDPLKVSMEKQEQMKAEMRLLLNLNIASLNRSSADAKQEAQKGLEAGLSYIGLVLETAEQRIADLWAMYQASEPAIINYPTKYSLKSDEQVYNEAEKLQKFRDQIPSHTFKQALSKEIVLTLMSNRVPVEVIEQIYTEIDQVSVIITDPEVIIKDHEAGLVSTKLASELRGFPAGEWEQAAKDHAARAKRIAEAQSSIKDPGARGVDDMSNDTKEAEEEKKEQ